ncbi:hypothetical protein F5884DRAFT_501145 [Xylogone sp. PMI_703]|nr:hypothetical protein F5884DRAFT_501145 [Xylogone sp. PMI_703]
MLGDIDPAYAIRDLDTDSSPSKWLSRKRSLEAVYKSLRRYVHNHCDELSPIFSESMIDINGIAEHEDEQQIVKLLTIILMAAVKGSENTRFVQNITERLDPSTQAEIVEIIKSMENVAQNAPTSPAQESTISSTLAKDLDLALEADHADLLAEYRDLQKRHADFQARFEDLQSSYDHLIEEFKEKDHLLRTLEDSKNGETNEYVKRLRKELQEANDLIASQEQQMELDQATRDKHQKELDHLRAKVDRLTEIEDQVSELRTENLNLSRKANMVDHFQKKLEAQSIVEKENARLRQRLENLEEIQKDYDKVFEENQKLLTTIQEYQRRFNSYELHVVELGNQKKVLEDELRRREAQITSLTDKRAQDERYIQDLEEQIRADSQTMQPVSSAEHEGGGGFLTLEQELEETNTDAEVNRLKTENQLLKSSAGGTSNAVLRVELEEADGRIKRLEARYNDLEEKYIIAQEQVQAMVDTTSGDKNENVINTRNLYLEASKELTAAKAKVNELTTELSSKERELLSAKTDLASMGKLELEALEDLKSANGIIKSSLEKDLLLLQGQYKNLQNDYDQQNRHLVTALLGNNKFRAQVASLQEQIVASAKPEVEEPEVDEQLEEKTDAEKNRLTEGYLELNLPRA